MRLKDALGRDHDFPDAPRRIVSLVPSITELLFALGLDREVVGVTTFCIHPAERVADRPKVGGTKNPLCTRILSLRPDVVIANKEENRRRDVERLEAAGVRVFVTYPRSVREAMSEIEAIAELTRTTVAARPILDDIEAAREEARVRFVPERPRVVALIWKNPWMAVGGDTFAHDMLMASGGQNPFAEAERRYPRLADADLGSAQPDVILLPTEPYAFDERDRLDLLGLDCAAARSGRIHIVEGELLSWYGPRMGRALRIFSELIAS